MNFTKQKTGGSASRTIGGSYLFLVALLVAGSGFGSLRTEFAGTLIHPYLVAIAPVFPMLLLNRLRFFPAVPLAAMLVFAGTFGLSSIAAGGFLGQTLKSGASIATLLTAALLIKNRSDFVAGVTGLSLAIAILAVKGVSAADAAQGVNPFDTSNKNAYSMYALPTCLLAGWICLKLPDVSKFTKSMLASCIGAAFVAIFMSGNRSGYLGAVVVGLLVIRERKFVGALLVFAIAGAVFLWITNYGSTEVFTRRVEQTQTGARPVSERLDILLAAFAVGLENPIAGVSPSMLPFEIQRQLGNVTPVGPHNVWGSVIGANGVICFLALIAVGVSLARWTPVNWRASAGGLTFLEARRLLASMVMLWAFRGMFNDEILFNPGFSLGLGLCVGLCLSILSASKDSERGPKFVPPFDQNRLSVPRDLRLDATGLFAG